MLGIGSNLITSAYRRGLAYVRDSLKLYMPYRGANHSEVKFVGEGSAVFDGTNDYILCGDNTDMDITDDLTMMCWVKPSVTTTGFLMGRDDGSNRNYFLYVDGSTKFGHDFYVSNSNNTVTSTTDVEAGIWYHVAVTRVKSTGKHILYVNGVAESTDTDSTASIDNDDVQFSIGARDNGALDFTGLMKNVAVWSRALTAIEIQDVMYKTYDELDSTLRTNLLRWYSLEDGSGSTAVDSTGTQNGSVSGSQGWKTTIYGDNTPMKPRIEDTAPRDEDSPPDFGTLYSGRALVFDGVADYLETGELNDIFAGASKLSVMGWVYLNSIASNNGIIGKFQGSNERTNIYTDSNGHLYFQLANGSDSNGSYQTALGTSKWIHYACIYDGTATGNANRMKIYIDGISQTLTFSGTIPATTSTNATYKDDEVTVGAIENGNYLDGRMSNLQIWDTALTEAEVQYSYTHPEKFAYNTSGSSLTTSNLALWYSMLESGFDTSPSLRSPQMYITDGNTKGLGSDLVTNGTFDADSNWTHSGNWQISSGTLNTSSALAGATNVTQSGILVVGKVYKVTLTVTRTAGNLQIRFGTAEMPNISADGNYTWYGTATGNTDFIIRGLTGFHGSVDNVVVKEVKMGNHGATTFLGDELIDETNDRTFAGASNWANVDFGSYDESGDLSLNASGNNQYCTLPVADAPMTAGRRYRLTFDLANCGTAFKIQDFGANQDFIGFTTLDNGAKSYDFTAATGVTGGFRIVAQDSSSQGDFDNFSLKEIGVAGGWTTVDNEPQIPQTALMNLSKKHIFDGVDDHVVIADNNAFSFGDGNTDSSFSISAWILPYTIADFPIISKGVYNPSGTGTGEWRLGTGGDGKLALTLYDDAADAYFHRRYDTALTSGKLYHIVATYNGSDAVTGIELYINGELMSNTDATSGTYDSMDNFAGAVHIGRYSSDYAHGLIDEVSIWNERLTTGEVQELFDDGVPLNALNHSTDDGSTGMVGYWRNNNLTTAGLWEDISSTSKQGTGIDGTMTNFTMTNNAVLPQGTVSGSDILGFPITHTNSGLFNSTHSNYILVNDNNSLDFGTGDFSIEFWVKFDDTVNGSMYILDNRGTSPHWRIYYDSSGTPKVKCNVHDGSSEVTGEMTGIVAQTWYHLVFVNDDGTLRLYRDTSAVGTADISSLGSLTTANKLYIGASQHGTDSVRGQLDEVKIYTKALSVAEVTKNYNHGKSKHS